MAQKDPRVDAYIANAADFARPILKHLRALIHAGVRKWKRRSSGDRVDQGRQAAELEIYEADGCPLAVPYSFCWLQPCVPCFSAHVFQGRLFPTSGIPLQ